ncbi:hypothetical protein ACPZ19_42310 [Amycolatopsis lurida]
MRPGAGRRQRAFLLLDESAQLNQPVGFTPERAGWWYVDLVDIREEGDTVHVVDFIVGPPGLPYRVLDLHELGEAMTSGKLTPRQVPAGRGPRRAGLAGLPAGRARART